MARNGSKLERYLLLKRSKIKNAGIDWQVCSNCAPLNKAFIVLCGIVRLVDFVPLFFRTPDNNIEFWSLEKL